MKVLAVIVCAAIFAASYAQEETKEENKARVMKFYKCLACTKDETFKEEYMKCEDIRLQTSKDVVLECKLKLMPEATTLQERRDRACRDGYAENEALHECIVNDVRMTSYTDEEKIEQQKFIECRNAVEKKYCSGE